MFGGLDHKKEPWHFDRWSWLQRNEKHQSWHLTEQPDKKEESVLVPANEPGV